MSTPVSTTVSTTVSTPVSTPITGTTTTHITSAPDGRAVVVHVHVPEPSFTLAQRIAIGAAVTGGVLVVAEVVKVLWQQGFRWNPSRRAGARRNPTQRRR